MNKKPFVLLLVAMLGSALLYADSTLFNSIPQDGTRLSLAGEWRFRYVAGSDAGKDEAFHRPDHDLAGWSTIKVPGHWELQGFAEPKYAGDLAEGLGLYRRTFRLRKPTDGGKVYLRFDGVLFGHEAWVNGRKVGAWNLGFNPATYDVTDALLPGESDNVLAVRVSTRSRGWDFDTMDCWSLSGIYRDVTLFSLPANHLLDHTVRTTLAPDGSATVELSAQALRPGTLVAKVRGPDGKPAGEATLALGADGQGRGRIVVAHAQTWTAETPTLYALELELKEGDTVAQRRTDRIGLRQVEVRDGVLMLNGKPIKLRGVDHHDIWPEEGRVATAERVRRDLTLMRAANINFIRTSHYPPHPVLLELADELGLYVDCEVPFIHGREHLKDPSFQEDLYARARATVGRDKNHASVIFWSIGNENPVNPLGLNVGKLVKELDPTRPITFPTMGSHFRTNWQKFPAQVDLYAPHYPSGSTIAEYAAQLDRPIVATEYAHMRGISRGGKGLQDAWDAMWASPRAAGGAIWQFEDQGLLRTTDDASKVPNADQMVWLDAHRYYDTFGYFGVDGIVYSDRTPQLDYWWVRKVYAPVRIELAAPTPEADGFALTVENRHDFRALQGYALRWSLLRNGQPIQEGSLPLTAAARATEQVRVPAKLPADVGQDVFALALRCVDPAGASPYERCLQLATGNEPGARATALQKALPAAKLETMVDDQRLAVRHPAWTLEVDRRTGGTTLRDAQGKPLVTAAGPHVARKLLITEVGKRRENTGNYWQGELLAEPRNLRTSLEATKDGVVVRVAGSYLRPGHPEQSVDGECEYAARPTGAIKVAYRYAPTNAQDSMVETGLALAVPAALTEFRWLGQGPYASYPGKDRQSEYGLHHLGREDLYFPGNRRGTELALLTSPAGAGLLLAGEDMTISVETRGATTLWSHLAEGSRKTAKPKASEKTDAKDEGVDNKADIKASAVKAISGRFVLLPVQDTWPAPLNRWFGAPGAAAPAFRPFLSSYDQ